MKRRGYNIGELINFLIELEEKNPDLDVDSMEIVFLQEGEGGSVTSSPIHKIGAYNKTTVIFHGVEKD